MKVSNVKRIILLSILKVAIMSFLNQEHSRRNEVDCLNDFKCINGYFSLVMTIHLFSETSEKSRQRSVILPPQSNQLFLNTLVSHGFLTSIPPLDVLDFHMNSKSILNHVHSLQRSVLLLVICCVLSFWNNDVVIPQATCSDLHQIWEHVKMATQCNHYRTRRLSCCTQTTRT